MVTTGIVSSIDSGAFRDTVRKSLAAHTWPCSSPGFSELTWALWGQRLSSQGSHLQNLTTRGVTSHMPRITAALSARPVSWSCSCKGHTVLVTPRKGPRLGSELCPPEGSERVGLSSALGPALLGPWTVASVGRDWDGHFASW